MSVNLGSHPRLAGWVLVLWLVAWPAMGQEIFAPVQELDFEDPEAWAMAFFT